MYQALPIGVEVGLLLEELLAVLEPDQEMYSTHDIIAALPHTQLAYLGNGAFGVAASAYLSGGREIVLKLAGRDGDGYPWWAEYCKDNPAKHLPEVYYTARVGALHVTAMKKYVPLDYGQEDTVLSVSRGICDYDPELAASVNHVRDLIQSLDGGVDMHIGNFMYDPDSDEIIITDPCSYMPPDEQVIVPPRQRELDFEVANMGTAINSLLVALRKAEELHGKEQPDSLETPLDKDLQRWSMPKEHLFSMDFADAEARMALAMEGKADDEFMKFIRNKWG